MPDPYATVQFYAVAGSIYEFVYDENAAAWRIRHTAGNGAQEYSQDNWESKHAAALAFENGQLAYREEA